jgi:hypothetical protein
MPPLAVPVWATLSGHESARRVKSTDRMRKMLYKIRLITSIFVVYIYVLSR